MQRMLALVLSVGLLPPLAQARPDQANYDKHEQIYKDLLKGLSDLAEAFESVKDVSTAKQAATKIEDVCNRFERIAEDHKKLPKLTAEELKKLDAVHMAEFQKIKERLQAVALQANVNAGGEASYVKSLKRLDQAAKKLEAIGKGL